MNFRSLWSALLDAAFCCSSPVAHCCVSCRFEACRRRADTTKVITYSPGYTSNGPMVIVDANYENFLGLQSKNLSWVICHEMGMWSKQSLLWCQVEVAWCRRQGIRPVFQVIAIISLGRWVRQWWLRARVPLKSSGDRKKRFQCSSSFHSDHPINPTQHCLEISRTVGGHDGSGGRSRQRSNSIITNPRYEISQST